MSFFAAGLKKKRGQGSRYKSCALFGLKKYCELWSQFKRTQTTVNCEYLIFVKNIAVRFRIK